MPGGDAGRAGNGAGLGEVPCPAWAGVVHTVYKAFASWVCGPHHALLQCGVALVWMSPCACISQPAFEDIKVRGTFPSQSAPHVCMSLSHNVNPCDY